jgi:hypothetical protein
MVDTSGNRIDASSNKIDASNNKIKTTTALPPHQPNKGVFDLFQTSLAEFVSLNNILAFIWFLAIYFVIFIVIKTFYRNSADPFKEKQALGRSIDMFLFGLLIVVIVYSYYSLSEKDKKDIIGYGLIFTRDFYNNPNTFFNLSFFILLFYCFVYFCGVPMAKETRPISIYFLEQKLWLVLFSVIFVDFFKYILGISLMDIIFGTDGGIIDKWYNLKTGVEHEIKEVVADVSHVHVPVMAKKPEVFNISNNLYTYDDAQAVCQSFDARMANVDEINQAYEDGAEWCVNSWSADRQVLFPTQQATYDKLQKIKGAENSCGRTGVNGGRINNVNLRFGVNCFGVKPSPTDGEKKRMNDINHFVHPKTKEEMIIDAKVNFWKNNRDKYIVLNPFNESQWNR